MAGIKSESLAGIIGIRNHQPWECSSWLDDLPFYAAAKACEMVGAVEIHGLNPPLQMLTGSEWTQAGKVGFEIMLGGPTAYRDFLENNRPAKVSMVGDPREDTLFGKLSTWLGQVTYDEVYDPLRDVMREVVMDTFALSPEEYILGKPVRRRRLHSIRSAGDQIGWTYERLLKVLKKEGFVDEKSDGLSFDAVVFAADKRLEEFLSKLNGALTFRKVAERLNATRVQCEQLIEYGFITPTVGGGGELNNYAFDANEIDQFLDRLMANVSEVESTDDSLLCIPDAGKKAQSPNMDIIRLIIEGRVHAVRASGTFGYRAIRVDAMEVKTILNGDGPCFLSILDIERQTGWHRRVIEGLMETGILPYQMVSGRRTGIARKKVLKSDLEAFDQEYVHSFALAKALQISRQSIHWKMQKEGIFPAFDSQGTPAAFYRRDEIHAP